MKKLKIGSKEIVSNIAQFFSPDVSKTLEQCDLGYVKVIPSHKAQKEKLHSAFLWLGSFSAKISEYQAIRQLHTEEVWGRFTGIFAAELNDSEEMLQLKEKKLALISMWKQRPGVLRKTRPGDDCEGR